MRGLRPGVRKPVDPLKNKGGGFEGGVVVETRCQEMRRRILKIQVKPFGVCRKYVPHPYGSELSPFSLELEQGARLGGVLTLLGIPEEGPEAVVHNHRAGKKSRFWRMAMSWLYSLLWREADQSLFIFFHCSGSRLP